MPAPADPRRHPRLKSSVRVLWSVLGTGDLQIDRLRNVSASGALVATESLARVGEEIRFDLLDDDGEKLATGLARVVWVDAARGMGISFLALGVDTALVASLASTDSDPFPEPRRRPPPIPGAARQLPPLPAEDLVAEEDVEVEDETALQVEPLAVRRTGTIIGIDLGTTNTCVSYVVDGKPRIIPGRTGTNTIPSMITFEPDGSYHVGQRAADRQVLQPLRTVYGWKRLVGRTFREEIAAELQKHFAYPLGEADEQRFGIRLDDRVVSMDTIAVRVLEEVRSTAEAHLGIPVEAAVITVPAYFSEVQREAVRRAARDAKLAVHRIVNEPTAAAVAYGHKQGGRARVAVWDFGGGTFDFSVVDVTERQLEVIATGGDNFVGGADFDDLLAAHLFAEFQRAEGLTGDPDPQQIARLREAAEHAKRGLSVQTEVLVELPEMTRDPKRTLRVEVTRERFDELTRSLVERTVAIARDVMMGAGIAPSDVEDVLLVGGTTRIPAVQRAVAELFGRRPSKRINPDEAVSLGAALLADEIGASSVPALLDILPMTIGYGEHGLHLVPIVKRNARLPTNREVTLDADLLGTVSLPLFQGESPDVSQDEYICTVTVEDPSLRDGGRVVVRLSFDEHCVMAVDARDARTGKALRTTLDRSRPVDDILRDLGKYEGPRATPAWKPPESGLGRVLGKLFRLIRR